MVDAKRVVTWHFYFTKIVPIGLFMALTLHFGNLVYMYLTVAFIQMLKVGIYDCLNMHISDGSVNSWMFVQSPT